MQNAETSCFKVIFIAFRFKALPKPLEYITRLCKSKSSMTDRSHPSPLRVYNCSSPVILTILLRFYLNPPLAPPLIVGFEIFANAHSHPVLSKITVTHIAKDTIVSCDHNNFSRVVYDLWVYIFLKTVHRQYLACIINIMVGFTKYAVLSINY